MFCQFCGHEVGNETICENCSAYRVGGRWRPGTPPVDSTEDPLSTAVDPMLMSRPQMLAAVRMVGVGVAVAGVMALVGWSLFAFGDTANDSEFATTIQGLVLLAGLGVPVLVLVSAGILASSGDRGASTKSLVVFGQVMNALSALTLVIFGAVGVIANLSEIGTEEADRLSGFSDGQVYGNLVLSLTLLVLGLLVAVVAVGGTGVRLRIAAANPVASAV